MNSKKSMYHKIFGIKNKTVIITGANGRIGKKIVSVFKRLGAKVISIDLNKKNYSEFKNLKNKNKNEIKFFADISKKSHVQEVLSFIKKKKLKIDVLINSHQIKPDGFLTNKPEKFNEELWDKIIRVNLTGTFLTCKYFGGLMIKQNKGSIINLGSTYGSVSSNSSLYKDLDFGNPVAYTASKGGVSSLTKYLAAHWGKNNVRVNCLIPHGVENNQSKVFIDRFKKLSPLNRMMKIDEIIGPIIFLSSDASSYCTGSDFLVEGGWTSW